MPKKAKKRRAKRAPRKPGPEAERLRIELDPGEALDRLLRPLPPKPRP